MSRFYYNFLLVSILILSSLSSANAEYIAYQEICGGQNTIINSDVINSEIICSDVENSYILESTIQDSTLPIVNSRLEYATIMGNSLVSGKLFFEDTGFTYYGPRRLDHIYISQVPPSPIGSASVSHPNIAPGNDFYVMYSSGATGYSVTLDASSVGGDENIQLLDNGQGNDKNANDGIYTSPSITVSSDRDTGEYDLHLTINDNLGNEWPLTISINVDATPPTGSIQITSTSNTTETGITSSRVVYLFLEFDDNVAVDGCRFANENQDIENKNFISCEEQMSWILSEINGIKNVSYQVKDTAGLLSEVYWDTIELETFELDYLPILEMASFWGNPNFINFNVFYPGPANLNEIIYQYQLLADGINITPWKFSERSDVVLSNLNLSEGINYTLVAFARQGSISPESMVNFTFDASIPEIVSLSSSIEENVWSHAPIISFSATAEAPEILGFSYRLSSTGLPPDSNIDVYGDKMTLHFGGLSPGVQYFTLKAFSTGLAESEIINFTILYDNSLPPAPVSDSAVQSGIGDLEFNWSSGNHLSGIQNYHVQISADSFFENIVDDSILDGNQNNYVFLAPRADTYFMRVRARSGSGLYGPFSSIIATPSDLLPPKFIFVKPLGTIVNNRPIFRVETNKDSNCFYSKNFSIDAEISNPFYLTGSNIHETRLNLNNGDYDIAILCRDSIGNFNSEVVPLTVDNRLNPSSINILGNEENMQAIISSDLDIEIQMRSSNVPIGELPLSEFSISIDGAEYDEFAVNDIGNGSYILTFEVPDRRGKYKLNVCYSNICLQSITLEVVELMLEIINYYYDASPRKISNMAYISKDDITFGFASDSSRFVIEDSAVDTQIEMRKIIDSGNSFIFFVPNNVTDMDLETKNRQLNNNLFYDSINPSFQLPTSDIFTSSLFLHHSNLVFDVESDSKISRGRYNLLIENKGNTKSGNVNISIRVN